MSMYGSPASGPVHEHCKSGANKLTVVEFLHISLTGRVAFETQVGSVTPSIMQPSVAMQQYVSFMHSVPVGVQAPPFGEHWPMPLPSSTHTLSLSHSAVFVHMLSTGLPLPPAVPPPFSPPTVLEPPVPIIRPPVPVFAPVVLAPPPSFLPPPPAEQAATI